MHVLIVGNVGPVLPQHGAGLRVLLDGPSGSHSGALKAKVEAADASEEGANPHAASWVRNSSRIAHRSSSTSSRTDRMRHILLRSRPV